MHYSATDLTYVKKAAKASHSRHIIALAEMTRRGASYFELFEYGMLYLPHIRDKKTGKVNLDLLDNYIPEIVEYFHVLSEIPTMPLKLKNVATDFAIYADGESVQIDETYFNLNPVAELETALKET